MPRKRTSRLYWKQGRAYADFRDYRDVGGNLRALVPPGQTQATTDPDVAAVLIGQQVKALEERRRGVGLVGRAGPAVGVTLAVYAHDFLLARKAEGEVTDAHLRNQERELERALGFLGPDRALASITVADVKAYLVYLRTLPGRKGGTLSGDALRHHLFSLSALFAAAEEQEVVPGNPVQKLRRKPTATAAPAVWLESPDAAAWLAACRTVRLTRADLAVSFLPDLMATFLLTGGRRAEVFGLEESDILFDRELVLFRPNRWRRLKNAGSARAVPLWPQLAVVLRAYLNRREVARLTGATVPTLLFPSRTGGLLEGCQKALGQVERSLGWPESRTRGGPGALTWKAFRHTYCAARLQTLDGGEPISPYAVGKEMGHGGSAMVQKIYGHLGTCRHRSEVVEYLEAGPFVTGNVTGVGPEVA